MSERLEATEEELASLRSHSQSTLAAAEAKAKHAKLVRSVTVSQSVTQAGRQAVKQAVQPTNKALHAGLPSMDGHLPLLSFWALVSVRLIDYSDGSMDGLIDGLRDGCAWINCLSLVMAFMATFYCSDRTNSSY